MSRYLRYRTRYRRRRCHGCPLTPNRCDRRCSRCLRRAPFTPASLKSTAIVGTSIRLVRNSAGHRLVSVRTVCNSVSSEPSVRLMSVPVSHNTGTMPWAYEAFVTASIQAMRDEDWRG